MLHENSAAVNELFSVVDRETGEVQSYVWQENKSGERVAVLAYDQDAADLERWMLQQSARRLLHRVEYREKRIRVPFSEFVFFSDVATRQVKTCLGRERFYVETEFLSLSTPLADDKRKVSVDGAASALKRVQRFRVVDCCRVKIGADNPEIWYSKKSARASYHKVGVCGSVHVCPVCARRVQLQRQEQIKAAYNVFIDQGKGDAVMVTFTVPHGIGDDLRVLFDAVKKADRGFMQKSYNYKKFVGYKRTVKGERVAVPSIFGYVGRISASEVTYGKNGWHPHSHQLWFFDRKLTDRELVKLRRGLFAEWAKACEAVGLPVPKEYDRNGRCVGVDVRRALSAAQYLTKFGNDRLWGPEKEIASQASKGGKKGRSPFELLKEYGEGNKQSGALFYQYADATLGRHQLEFSTGLKALLVEMGMNEILASDEELAAIQGEDSEKIGELTDNDFAALKGAETVGVEAFGTMLNICKRQGFDSAVAWLRSLPVYDCSARDKSGSAMLRKLERLQADFWSFVNLIDCPGKTAAIEDEAALLLYEYDMGLALRDWSGLVSRVKHLRFSGVFVPGSSMARGGAVLDSVPFDA